MENLSYFHQNGDEPLKYLTFGKLAEIAASKFANIVAVDSIEQNSKLTFAEALQEADKFAMGLRKLGINKGDKLGLWAPNCLEWYIVNMACLRTGILLVSLNPASVSLEMEYLINTVGINVIVCPYDGNRQNYYDVLMQISPELETTEKSKFSLHKLPSLKGIILISDEQPSAAYNYKEVIEMGSLNQTSCVSSFQSNIQPDDACYILFSSGTTGRPKAILLNHFQIVNNSYISGKRLEFNQKHYSICLQIPMFHIFGVVVAIACGLHYGVTLVVPSQYYTSTKNIAAMFEKRCSFVFGTPTMFIDLISAKETIQNPSNMEIECAVLGAAPVSPGLIEKMKTILNIKHIKLSYGLTEFSGTAFISFSNNDQEWDTMGCLCDHLEVKIIDANGVTLPMGEAGELCLRGYSVMIGYLNDEESTKKTIQRDGWLRTGDIGILKSNGYGKIIGRKTDVIIRGGENIYPKEIEDVLNNHPSILEAQVVGIPNERLGEEVCACIKLRTGFEITQSQMNIFCKNKIAKYKIPTRLISVDEFPRTTSGKVYKTVLKKQISDGVYNKLL